MNTITPHQEKALNIEKSISLTANAGSGKTFVLAQRFLQIITSTSAPLTKIAAITFTEKAAGELFKRISVELEKLLLSVTNSEIKLRIEKIRKQLVSAKISTIHSFCIDLLKEFPVESSLDANFSTINEQKASELINISVESALKDLLNDSQHSSNIKYLVRLLGSKAKLVVELSELISKRRNVLDLIEKYYSTNEKEISGLLYNIFETNAKNLFENKSPIILKHLNKINECVLEINPKNVLAIEIKSEIENLSVNDDLISTLKSMKGMSSKLLTINGVIRTRGYLPSKNRNEVLESIELVETFFTQLTVINLAENHKEIEKELSRHIIALVNVFKECLSIYENKKSELGVLDFEDILLNSRRLLDNTAVRESLKSKFDYLLVDEYQDTNEIQYEIFLPLVDDLKKGNLFIVGDEKQSIYRFRDADLKVFSKTKADISLIYGNESLLTLPDSFRMAPAICLFVNSIFKSLFKEARNIFDEVLSTDLVCARSDSFEGKVEILIADESENNEAEAELTVKTIIRLKEEFKERLKNWNDFAILVRKRASFTELQKAFIKYKVPFNIIGGTGFYQKQSISDIYNYFAFLLNDKNDAALIGALRSPFFLISDVELFNLSTYDGDSYWEKIKSAKSEKNEIWQQVCNIIETNKNLSNRISIPVLLRKILKESNFISVISSRINADQELSNLNKLISITNDFFNDEFSTLYDYVTFLNDSILGTVDEAQGKVEQGNLGVNIMTIHQAKGLEFPAVFFYKCNDTGSLHKVKSKSFTVDKEFGILTKVPLKGNYFGNYESAPIVGIYNLIEEKKELAELKRLFYVGLTRAKDFLFVTQSEDAKTPKKNSFTELLVEGIGQELSNEKIKIVGELEFLKQDQGKFTSFFKKIDLNIPITRNIDIPETNFETNKISIEEKKLNLSEINDKSKGEVISATRYSAFSSCPMKYNLIYNYKLRDLIRQSNRFNAKGKYKYLEEYSRNELTSHLLDDQMNLTEYSIVKGELIHQILRKNINRNLVPHFIEYKLKNISEDEIHKRLKDDITDDLLQFYDSSEFKYLMSLPNHQNEFEVYLKEQDYYLFGILDKLIIDNEKIIIVDYKSNNINENEIITNAEKYIPQLKFYAYIISRFFSDKKPIECRIIFIKYPEKPFVFLYNKSSDEEINAGIKLMISSIRSNNYSLNLRNCKECIFVDDHSKCVKISSELN